MTQSYYNEGTQQDRQESYDIAVCQRGPSSTYQYNLVCCLPLSHFQELVKPMKTADTPSVEWGWTAMYCFTMQQVAGLVAMKRLKQGLQLKVEVGTLVTKKVPTLGSSNPFHIATVIAM